MTLFMMPYECMTSYEIYEWKQCVIFLSTNDSLIEKVLFWVMDGVVKEFCYKRCFFSEKFGFS